MNRIIVIACIIVFLSGGCSFPGYLPTTSSIGVNEFGSYISITRHSGKDLRGELIAVDSSNIFVLTDNPRQCVALPTSQMKAFSLRYAKGKAYGWTVPLYSLFTISHGWFLIITFPVNLITTLIVTNSGRKSFTYSEKDINIEYLSSFARFPQGIPPGIDIASIN